MTLSSVVAGGADDLGRCYDKHIPAVRALLCSLPEARPAGSYPGGLVLKVNAAHYVAVLLPPTGRAEENLLGYLGEYSDGGGDWETFAIEAFGTGAGQVVAWHMTPPWA